jgi:murein L,D-transpeptidase YcbB/YkuD
MTTSLKKNRYFLSIPLVAIFAVAPIVSKAQILAQTAFETLLNQATAEGGVNGVKFIDSASIKDFYVRRGSQPLWADRAQAQMVLGVLDEAWTQGLNPQKYHVQALHGLIDDAGKFGTEEARADLILTDAVIRYGYDVSGMRLNPAAIDQRAQYWRQPEKAAQILKLLENSTEPARLVAAMAPHDSLYSLLRKEMVRVSREGAAYDSVLPMKFGRTYFHPHGRSKAVPALRMRLGVKYEPRNGKEDYYDDRLAAAVMAFQRQHNLKPDGIIGGETLALLNQSRRQRMEQLVANLERLRWLDQNIPARYVLVNIPSQTLWAVEDGKVAFKMPVVVGKPDRPTHTFRADIIGIRFNPTWTVPMGIKVKDMLPQLQEDPNALADKGIDIMEDGESIDPSSIDWQNISRSELNHIRMVQSAGDHNALGRIRVLMPNEFDIYLHDTNHPEFFNLVERTASSGCIRLSQPEQMARFVLAHNKGWSDKKMNALIARGTTSEVPVADKLPVYIIYQTLWKADDGTLIYGPDVYGEDKRLVSALSAINGYILPDIQIGSIMGDKGIPETPALASAR